MLSLELYIISFILKFEEKLMNNNASILLSCFCDQKYDKNQISRLLPVSV